MNSPCLRLVRGRLFKIAQSLGYQVDGNHVFSASDYEAIQGGKWRASVSENPAQHPTKVRRLAFLVASTY